MFSAPRILYFTAEEHYLYRSAGRALELEAKFTGDEAGIAAFRDYLRGQRGALFAVVADLAGEDFHEEQIPYLRGADREAGLSRRLAQRYRDTRLAAALSLGTVDTAERKNERVLLTSFTNTQQLAPWLDALEEAGAKLSGVYSIPLLAPALAKRLAAREPRLLLVTANRAGLRQCYVENGKLRFARLERTGDMVPQALALFVRSETQRLVQYLVTLRAMPPSKCRKRTRQPRSTRASRRRSRSPIRRPKTSRRRWSSSVASPSARRTRRRPSGMSRACSNATRSSSSTACAG